MVAGTLYTYPGNYRAQKALIAAAYSGAAVTVDADFEFGQTNTSDAFLKKFPMGKVPAFEDSNGVCLSESNAIAYYVSNETLRGTNPIDQALVLQYVEFAENEILPSACTWVYPTLGFKQYNKQDTEKAQTHIKKCLALLNEFLATRTFLVGERVTLADISLCCNMVMLYVQVLDPNFRKSYGNVDRWFTTCINQPNFKKVLGDVVLCEKMAQFDNKRFAELHPKDNKKAGKDAKPKAAKAAPAAAPAEKPAKKVDVFANVPATEFVMDSWKKFYSNNDADKFLPYLWENFDSNAWSMWHCEYKYPEEMQVQFKTSNAIDGFFQRLEGCRKHLFGNVLMFKEGDHFTLSGVWLQKGQDLIFTMEDGWNYDAEHYNWRKLNPESVPVDKNCVDSYLNWEGDYLAGRVPHDGSTFK